MSFARPLLLTLFAIIPVWLWFRSRRRNVAARYSDTRQLAGAGRSRSWVAQLPVGLRVIAIGSWIVAAAGPEVGLSSSESTSEGIAIVLAVDVSTSMLAEDFSPSNRLDVAREQSVSFINGRRSDRIGLVSFAGEALTRVPITLDYQVLEKAVYDLRVGELEDGTAIGTAIATSANRLRRTPGKSRVIVLLTDGENNRGRVDPVTAAEAAAKLGIKIYTIGVGTEGEARMPIGRSLGGGLRYQMLPVKIDEELLKKVAAITGGRYFRATDAEALSRIFKQIDQLEKMPVEITRFTQFDEAYRTPLLLGMGALALELLVAATLVVRVP